MAGSNRIATKRLESGSNRRPANPHESKGSHLILHYFTGIELTDYIADNTTGLAAREWGVAMRKVKRGVLRLLVVVGCLPALATIASAGSNDIVASLSKLQTDIVSLRAENSRLSDQVAALRKQVLSLQTVVGTIKSNNVLKLGPYVSLRTDTLQGLIGPHIIFSGVNVHIRDGSGATNDNGKALTGLGNLIVGYDEWTNNPQFCCFGRSGSHNLVVGANNLFYSIGGLVAGSSNSLESQYDSIIGGSKNRTLAQNSSILGGSANITKGAFATVSGGTGNIAGGGNSAVSGGGNNEAQGDQTTVAGGLNNIASGFSASVGGGLTNIASGDYSTVSGGYLDQSTSFATSIGGGEFNVASGDNSTVMAGYQNTATGPFSTIVGGENNSTKDNLSVILGNSNNASAGAGSVKGQVTP
jgi:cell division protein FtsB